MRRFASAIVAATLALLLVPVTVSAQNVAASPTYGDVRLTEGFRPDPHTTRLTAGGSIEVNKGACTYGFVAEAPDVDLYYTTSGGSSLYIYAESDADVTLLVNAPDGSWLCNDDGLGNRDPLIAIPNASDGLYDIWIGTYGDEMQAATLYISEIAPGGSGGGSGGGGGSSASQISVGADPTYGNVRLSQGATSDTIELLAGGSLQPNFGECTYGNVASAPDVDLYYEGDGTQLLGIGAGSAGDVMLLVNLPDGTWVCDDDSGEDRNALVIVEGAAAGLYNIWVGTYGSEMEEAQLFIADEGGLEGRMGGKGNKGP
ncbi:MAG: hypothetical protein AAFP18_01325 [Bacteroidota bacterium]